MLIQLTIENFMSFRDEVTFSMVGVSSDRQHADRLIEDAAGKGRSVVPIAAIYGANAAGKSNLIEALSFAKELILEGTRSNRSIPVATFKLGDYSKKPSKFEFIFTHQDARYSYGFKLNKEQILEEWLHAIPPGKRKEVMYFERITSLDKKTTVDYGLPLTGRSLKRKQFLEFIAEGTRPNQLFLTEGIDRNVESLFPVANWFREILTIIMADSIFASLESTILSDISFTDFLSKFLKLAGTGIDKVGGGTVELDFDRHLPGMPQVDRDKLLQKFSGAHANSILMIEDNFGKQYLLLKGEDSLIKMIQLVTQHRHENGNLVDFAVNEESEGTQRLINLIPALFVLQEEEKVIFIDELDRRLHPLLSRLFVKTAIDCRGKNNQLIFTTHDTNLLDLDLLRRDEIWFVEKDRQGSSNLYSLTEFKTRPDLKIEKGYLNGRFGAIPFFGNPESLGWHSQNRDTAMETNEH
ncbi:ATP/GTP-binding protein [Chamaesiphon sp. OTE_75_metabat_556]|uniref:AAA family ATPase n=1 Tax=Chamaesiphon sp. OTE_75_metabat_556 TaxID=2964692 RepID=UPI00286B5307|nr:ATP/GTP-binding protein [Chamaesiphon sp. OTE_75_metabat_556]